MGVLTNKDFDNSVTFWKDLALMQKDELAKYNKRVIALCEALEFYATRQYENKLGTKATKALKADKKLAGFFEVTNYERP